MQYLIQCSNKDLLGTYNTNGNRSGLKSRKGNRVQYCVSKYLAVLTKCQGRFCLVSIAEMCYLYFNMFKIIYASSILFGTVAGNRVMFILTF